MPSPTDMDTPAVVTVTVIGVILIAVSVPFLRGAGEAAGQEYAITWSQATAAEGDAAIGPQNSPQDVEVDVEHQLVSSAIVEIVGCTDTAQAPLQQDAVLTFTLYYGNETAEDAAGNPITRDDVTCDNAGPFTFELSEQPDVATSEAGSADEAERAAYGTGNRTGTYRLEFSWSRPPGQVPPLPLPVGQPAFTGDVSLEVRSWRATANVPDEEVPR